MLGSPYLSEIRLFAFGYAPRNWAICAGQLLPISQNQSLFSLLGTTYGGNGQTTFALPDLRGRAALSFGQRPGGATYFLGQRDGVEAVTLALVQMPAHTHTINTAVLTATPACRNGAATERRPAGNVPAVEAQAVTATYSTAAPNDAMSTAALTPSLTAAAAGGGGAHDNRQPYLALTYCIALVGTFPTQN